jgi:DNA-binding response OmpR family regulator
LKQAKAGRKTILVVEDEPAICEVCARTLTGEGFDVDIAVNGVVAQDMVAKKEYDLCLLDIRTPVMNGKELYQHLKEEHPELTSKVIFTTGDIMNSKLGLFLKEAGRPFLPKPFTPDELRAIVRQALK